MDPRRSLRECHADELTKNEYLKITRKEERAKTLCFCLSGRCVVFWGISFEVAEVAAFGF